MSYAYAKGYGELHVSSPDKLEECFKKATDRISSFYTNWHLMLYKDTLIVFDSYEEYHEEDVLAVLDLLTPAVQEGSAVEFSDEDGCKWQLILSDGKWIEIYGGFVYDDMPIKNGLSIIRGGRRFFLTNEELSMAVRHAERGI